MATAVTRVLALCSGYGALEIAAERLFGADVVAHAENDPHAAQVFEAHHPGVPNIGDITKADWRKVRDYFEPEILAAGFPCTDISNAGLRIGIHGKRSGIWKNVAEAVRVTRPRLVLLENVAAIRSRGLDVVAADLAAIGYDARWTCVRAGDPEIGAPHQRDRWFCVAYPAAEDPDLSAWRERRPAAAGEAEGQGARADAGGRGGLPAAAEGLSPLPTPTASNPNDTESLESWEARRQRNLAKGINGNGQGKPLGIAVRQLLPTPAVRDWKSGASNLMETNSRPLNEFVVNLLSTPKASDGPHGGPNQRDAAGNYYLPAQADRLGRDWVATDGTDYGPAIRRWEAVTGRLAPFPTEPGMRGNRRLNPAFAEWMMGLPSGHVTGRGIQRKYELQMIGNGVVPQQAEYAYRLLLAGL